METLLHQMTTLSSTGNKKHGSSTKKTKTKVAKAS
jgi:hypothetical protein